MDFGRTNLTRNLPNSRGRTAAKMFLHSNIFTNEFSENASSASQSHAEECRYTDSRGVRQIFGICRCCATSSSECCFSLVRHPSLQRFLHLLIHGDSAPCRLQCAALFAAQLATIYGATEAYSQKQPDGWFIERLYVLWMGRLCEDATAGQGLGVNKMSCDVWRNVCHGCVTGGYLSGIDFVLSYRLWLWLWL